MICKLCSIEHAWQNYQTLQANQVAQSIDINMQYDLFTKIVLKKNHIQDISNISYLQDRRTPSTFFLTLVCYTFFKDFTLRGRVK